MTGWKLHEHITPYIINAGLYAVDLLGSIAIHFALVVERWRQETYTFHLPFGEATVRL